MDVIISDIRAVAESIFLGGNYVFLAMVVAAILVGVASMRNVGQVLCISVMALVVLALIWIGYGGATSGAVADPGTWLAQLEAGWQSMAGMTGSTLVGYLVVFAIAIIVLFLGKSILFRG